MKKTLKVPVNLIRLESKSFKFRFKTKSEYSKMMKRLSEICCHQGWTMERVFKSMKKRFAIIELKRIMVPVKPALLFGK